MSEITDNLKAIRDHLDTINAQLDRIPTKAQVLIGAVVFGAAFVVAVAILKRLV